MSSKKKKEIVLVTGGAGFIGGHLVDRLIQDGYAVRVVDSLLPMVHGGKLPSWFNARAEFIKGDVSSEKIWNQALKGVSYVFHLAAYMDFRPDYHTYIATNTESVALLFEALQKKGSSVKKIIMASSQSVYGEGKYHCRKHGSVYPAPRSEEQLLRHQWEQMCPIDHAIVQAEPGKESDTLHPLIPYGISKHAAEDLLFSLGAFHSIPVVALRYTIVHGPRQTFRHFYSGAMRQIAVMALYDEEIILHEDGMQIRDYVHVSDVVDAHMAVLRSSAANGRAFNVGSGVPTRVMDLAEEIVRITKSKARIVTKGLYRVGAPRHSPSDVSELCGIGWKPRKTLTHNVKDYIQWIEQFPEAKKYFMRSQRSMKENRIVRE